VLLLALPPVDESSLSYLIGYWGARIGIPLVVVVLVTRFIVGQVRRPRTPTSSARFGVTGASAHVQWPASPTPAQWPAPPAPAPASWPAPPVPVPAQWFAPPDSARPRATVAATERISQPAKGKHAK
jgi:hypothetical protein